MLNADATRGTASLCDEERVPLTVRWPVFKVGSTLLVPSLAEEVELSETLPNGWSTNVLEKPLFAGQVFLRRKPSLWDKLARLRTMIPPEERSRYPADGARNLDRYLYGSTS